MMAGEGMVALLQQLLLLVVVVVVSVEEEDGGGEGSGAGAACSASSGLEVKTSDPPPSVLGVLSLMACVYVCVERLVL
jgi:hypothetical protein